MSYNILLNALTLMFDIAVLFYTINNSFLKFEPTYYQALKQQKTCLPVHSALLMRDWVYL